MRPGNDGVVVAHVCRGREWRGGERQVRLLVETLAGRFGVRQYLLTGRGTPLATAVAGRGAALETVPWRMAWDPRALAGILVAFQRLRTNHPDNLVIHAHDSHALAVGALSSRLSRLPLVATRRSDTPAGRLWRLPDRVIAISGAVEIALRDAGVEGSRIVQIPSAVVLADLTRPGRPGGDSMPVIVAVGALTAEKGHAVLVRAFARLRHRLPRTRLVLVGDGPEREGLETLARRLGVDTAVEFTGERSDATPEIRAAHVLAQPSRREALGTAVLEAMALGTPIVASAVGGLVDLLGSQAGLLVPPDDPDALAGALARVLTDPGLADTLTRNARARVAGYDALELAERVAQVYRSALRTG